MCRSKQYVSDFRLEGWLLGFVFEDGYKLKGLRLTTSEGEFQIKLAKEVRYTLDSALKPGTWIQVLGEKKLKLKTGEVKLKGYLVKPATPPSEGEPIPLVLAATPELPLSSESSQSGKVAQSAMLPKTGKKATILVCQKSDCWKRGGREVCQALEAAVSERGLEGQVTIKGTGCMKNCKAGPNLVMPDKTRHSRIKAADIPKLMEKNFPAEQVPQETVAGITQ